MICFFYFCGISITSLYILLCLLYFWKPLGIFQSFGHRACHGLTFVSSPYMHSPHWSRLYREPSRELYRMGYNEGECSNVNVPHDEAVLFLGIDTKEFRAGTQAKAHTHVFKVALFIIAKLCIQLKCPLVQKWRRRMGVYLYNRIQP